VIGTVRQGHHVGARHGGFDRVRVLVGDRDGPAHLAPRLHLVAARASGVPAQRDPLDRVSAQGRTLCKELRLDVVFNEQSGPLSLFGEEHEQVVAFNVDDRLRVT